MASGFCELRAGEAAVLRRGGEYVGDARVLRLRVARGGGRRRARPARHGLATAATRTRGDGAAPFPAGISEASVKVGAVYKYDLSIPVEKLYDIVEEMRSRVGDMAEVLGYGHLGDGNLHLNILSSKYSDNILAQIEPFVYEWTASHRGSISAEHGLGLMKAEKIHYSKSPEAVQLMASIKKLVDPNSILNPYKVLPQSAL